MNILLIVFYVAAMVVANLLVWFFGPWFSPINAFVLIGLDLTLRDVMHERLTRWQLAAVICAGALLTAVLNPAAIRIAIASATAFICAAAVDWLAYELLHSRQWFIRSNGSNVFSAAVDSVIFPTMAFGVFLPAVIALQFAAKVGGGFLWSLALRPLIRRAT